MMSDGDSSCMSVTENSAIEILADNIANNIVAESTGSIGNEIANRMEDKVMEEVTDILADEIADELAEEIHLTAQSDPVSNNEDVDDLETEASITTVTELSNAEESNADILGEKESLNKTKNMFSALPQLGGKLDWYKDKCFKRYWDHYHYVMSWCQKHYETYNRLKERQFVSQNVHRTQRNWHSYQPWHNCIPPSHPYWNSFPWQQGHGQIDSKANKRSRKRGSRQKKEQKDPKLKEMDKEGTDEEQIGVLGRDSFEMEITEDMIKFFSKSEEHRKQRDERKKEDKEREKKEPELVNLEDVQVSQQRERTVEAPKERPGTRRTSEMKQLYGKGAAMIHGMETALQMTFDRNKDLKQPKLWPNMPLKIVFN